MTHRLHGMPFGAEAAAGGVRFALWAPSAPEVSVVVDGSEHAMPPAEDGWRRAVVTGIGAGSRYQFKVGDDLVPDPASRYQPDDVAGPSAVVDPRAHVWSDAGWTGRPWEEAVIYEAHVGTATPEGTFAALAERLDDLREDGFTAIELLPIADFAGRRNWGYDGVLPYAPDSAYGAPEDLKRLVERAHALGIMVLLDVVYNHFGPAGNHLSKYAASFFTDRHQTPWGAGLNVDGEDGRPVRDFFVENALYWLTEYHLDGLRFDAVHAILDDSQDHLIAELARRSRAVTPARHIHLVLENEHNQARWLERDASGQPVLHSAQWNDDIHHCWHVLLTGEREAYYEDFADRPVERLARALAEGFVYQGEASKHGGGKARGESSGHLPPSAFVAFLQNHDQIGNRAAGDRLSALAPEAKLALARAGLILTPQIPMLFMGEEWSASAPFQFFVDFSDDPDLSRAVRDGRRREFQHFAAFSGGGDEVPDPTDEATFRRSVLDWSERQAPGHAAVLADTRALLALRREHVVPLTKTAFLGALRTQPSPESLDVTWRYTGGTLRFTANLGSDPVRLAHDGLRPVWSSPGAQMREGGSLLPPWTGAVLTGADR